MKKKGLSDDTEKCCLNVPPAKEKRIIILHAGCVNRCVQNALLIVFSKKYKNYSAYYLQDMDSNWFETWFTQQLLLFVQPHQG